VTRSDKALLARMGKLRDLLAEFDVRLSGFDPGFSGFLAPCMEDGTRPGRALIRVDSRELTWIEPLLKELREYRRGAGELRFDSMDKFDREIKRADLERRRQELAAKREVEQAWLAQTKRRNLMLKRPKRSPKKR
jgi:hypothetical protein